MLEFKELQLALVIFRDLIVEEAKKNLLRDKKSSSGALYKSIKGNPVKTS